MAEIQEIPLELQLHEANRRIAAHLSKGRKFTEFLSPMFLRWFPAIMDNHLTVDWNTISGVYDRTPMFPITLIDTQILDDWVLHPSVWDVPPKQRHLRRVLAMVRYTLPYSQASSHKASNPVVYGASFVIIPSHQGCTSMADTLQYLKGITEDSVILVSMPMNPPFCPQQRKCKYLTLLPINSNPDVDRGPLHSFAAAFLPTASKEGPDAGTATRVRLPPCFGSSKQLKTEMLLEGVLLRGPLWPNANYVERNAKGQVMLGQTGKPICQELTIKLVASGKKMQYTNPNGPSPLTLAACHPGWNDYLDMGESVNEMAQHLMEEDAQQGVVVPTAGTTPQPVGTTLITPILPDHTVMVAAAEFPGSQSAGSSRDNPMHLSDANDTSTSTGRPTKDVEAEDDAAVLGHFSDALREMANSIMGLEEGYFKALCEVIDETERALRDVSCIDVHYVSQVVTVMSSWQEAVQTAASHMEGVDLTTYLARLEDMRRATHEYVKAVVQAHEERDATHAVEHEKQKEAIQANDLEDPVVRLLHVTRKAARVHCERAVDVFIDSIKATLRKDIPTHAQGPLIANALSTAFQFQMAIWQMIGEECVHPI